MSLLFRKLLSFNRTPFSRCLASFVLRSDLPDVHIPQVTIDQHLFARLEKWPEKIATECGATGRKYTYEEIHKKAVNLSRNLHGKLKLEKGDTVAVLLSNSPEFVLVVLGALRAGLVVTTLNPIYTADEISRQLIDSSAKVVFTFPDFTPLAKASVELVKKPLNIITIRTQQNEATPQGCINFDELTENSSYDDPTPANHEDVAFLPYSSGTTGLPKGVQLTHRNILANLCQFAAEGIFVLEETTKDHQDVVPAVLPKFHIYGLVANTLHLFEHGAKTVSIPKFTPELYLQVLRQHKGNVLFAAPPLVLFLAGHPAVTSSDLAPVHTVISGAAPLGALDEQRFLQKAGRPIKIMQGFGLTETSPMICFSRDEHRKMPHSSGSIGMPVPNTLLKVVSLDDEDDTPLGPNQKGELLVKGPQVMKGYHNNEEETRKVLKDGWLRTGDVVYHNDDGLLFVCDRLKELIKVKGFQVPPAELEEVIRTYPDVEDVAVIGIPHAKFGEVPKAFIVQKRGGHIDSKKLTEWVAQKVAPYKKLEGGVQFVGSIPKNASGKIMRRVLKQQVLQE